MYCALLGFDAPRCGVDYQWPSGRDFRFIGLDGWTDGYSEYHVAVDSAGDYWSVGFIEPDPDDGYDHGDVIHRPCFLGPRPALGIRHAGRILQHYSMPSDCFIDAVVDGYRWEQP